jgi:hypothetical protein
MNILLDVDGVLIRDHAILDRVRRNITHYVKNKIPRVKNPERLRDHLYTRYGHTGRGMTQALSIPTPDFNSYVYDKALLNQLVDYLLTDEFHADAKIVRNLLNQGHKVTLFSNAPYLWTAPVANVIDKRVNVETMVGQKPQPVAYASVRTNRRPIIIVDDVLKNLKPISKSRNWIPVHYSASVDDWATPTISTLEDLPFLVKQVENMYNNGRSSYCHDP